MNTRVTINVDDVIEIINDYSMGDRLTVKRDILDELRIEDTKENRKLLTKVTDELKKGGVIFTAYGLNEEEPGYRGRGYMMITPRFPKEASNEKV